MTKNPALQKAKKVTIAGAKTEKSLADRWRIIIKKCERSGLLYAAGFGAVK